MLEYMGYASVIWRVGFEANGKNVVFVISCNVQIFGPGFVMLQMEGFQLKLRDFLHALQREAMVGSSGLKKTVLLLEVGFPGKFSNCSQPSSRERGQKLPATLLGKCRRPALMDNWAP